MNLAQMDTIIIEDVLQTSQSDPTFEKTNWTEKDIWIHNEKPDYFNRGCG